MSFIKALDHEFRFLREALDLRAKRQELIAGNIANADTPNYSAKDIPFNKVLDQAMGSGPKKLGLATTAGGHIPSRPPDIVAENTRYRVPSQPSTDGNTVDMDVERAEFTQNALHYQLLLNQLRDETQEILEGIKPAQ